MKPRRCGLPLKGVLHEDAITDQILNWQSTRMTTEIRHLTVSGVKVEVVRKDIKNPHLGVYPPYGRVRVAAPLVVSDEAVRLAVIDKLGWIRRQKTKFAEQPRQSQREMATAKAITFSGSGIGCAYMRKMRRREFPFAVSPPSICLCARVQMPNSVKRYCCAGIANS